MSKSVPFMSRELSLQLVSYEGRAPTFPGSFNKDTTQTRRLIEAMNKFDDTTTTDATNICKIPHDQLTKKAVSLEQLTSAADPEITVLWFPVNGTPRPVVLVNNGIELGCCVKRTDTQVGWKSLVISCLTDNDVLDTLTVLSQVKDTVEFIEKNFSDLIPPSAPAALPVDAVEDDNQQTQVDYIEEVLPVDEKAPPKASEPIIECVRSILEECRQTRIKNTELQGKVIELTAAKAEVEKQLAEANESNSALVNGRLRRERNAAVEKLTAANEARDAAEAKATAAEAKATAAEAKATAADKARAVAEEKLATAEEKLTTAEEKLATAEEKLAADADIIQQLKRELVQERESQLGKRARDDATDVNLSAKDLKLVELSQAIENGSDIVDKDGNVVNLHVGVNVQVSGKKSHFWSELREIKHFKAPKPPC